MFIILGATGHVGSACAKALLQSNHEVTAVTRDAAKAEPLRKLGAAIAVADLYDVDAMRDVFRRGRRLFMMNPPADPSTDTDATEKDTARHLLAATDGSGLEKIVAESTYGAQDGDEIGDLNTLFGMEEGLRAQSIPHGIIRAAYYFSNWDQMLSPAETDGVLPTMFPADLKLPMVAPADLGRIAAEKMTAPIGEARIEYVEGPKRYSSLDVADAFSKALGKPVELMVTPRNQWKDAYRKLGFSNTAARSYARMTAKTADGEYEMPADPTRGTITLQDYIDALVARR